VKNVIDEVNVLAISSALSFYQTYGCTDRNSALEGHAEISPSSVQVQKEQERQCTCNIILRRSCNHCCSRKAIIIIYSECVFVAQVSSVRGACAILHRLLCLVWLYRIFSHYIINEGGGTEVKVLCYSSEGRWFDHSWCHWNFSFT